MKKSNFDINKEDVSDIIFRFKIFGIIFFYNAMSHKISQHITNIIRKRFIFFDFTKKKRNGEHVSFRQELSKIDGYYLSINEEKDEIEMILVKLAHHFLWFKWKPVNIIHIGRDFFGKLGEHFYHYGFSSFIDICGSVLCPLTEGDSKNFTDHICGHNYPYGAKNILLKYFNGGYISKDRDYPNMFVNIDNISLLRKQIDFKEKNIFGLKIVCEDIELPEINDDVLKKMEDIAYMSFICDARMHRNQIVTNRFSYLQKVGQDIIVRFFVPDYEIKFPISETTVNILESGRIKLVKGMTQNCNYIKFLDSIVIGRDENLEGTILEYATENIDFIIKYTDELLNEITKEDLLNDIYIERQKKLICRMNDKSYDNYSVYANHILILSYFISEYEFLDKILHIEIVEKTRLYHYLFSTRNILRNNIDNIIQEKFGMIYSNKKHFHEIIGLPRGCFEYIVENSLIPLYYISFLKEIFEISEESKQYFLRMNKHDYEYFINVIFCESKISESKIVFLMKVLIKIFGCKNWKRYYEKIEDSYSNGYLQDYYDFITRLEFLFDTGKEYAVEAKSIGWKIKKDNLNGINISLERLIYIAKNKEIYEKYKNSFVAYKRDWINYSFANDKYFIRIPEEPTEFIKEGATLRHCLKEFIQYVADGKTIILFIRQKDCPDDPFYTLEIRNKKIRQCHGYANKNITDDLKTFLRDFCEDKSIQFNIGDTALAVAN